MRRLLLFSAATALLFVVTPALALVVAPDTGYFDIMLMGDNVFSDGGGTGWSDSTGLGMNANWYYYQETNWYNQWWYDGPPDPTRWKEITYDIDIGTDTSFELEIALNWSTLDYPETGPLGVPPLPGMASGLEDLYIERDPIFHEVVSGDAGSWRIINITGTFIIPDYNPEWVSIDIRGLGISVMVVGAITHECIPAPGAIVLASIGVGLVGWLRRRRTL